MKYGVLGLGSIGTRHAQNLVNYGHNVIAFDPVRTVVKILIKLPLKLYLAVLL